MRASLTLTALAGSMLATANLLDLTSKAASTCSIMCKPLMELSQDCGSDTNCVCNNESFDVQTVGGACVNCLQQSNMPNDSLNKLAAACQFESVSYTPQMTVLAEGVTVDSKMTAPVVAAATGTSTAGETLTISTGVPTMSAGMTMTLTQSGKTITTTMASSTGMSMSKSSAARTIAEGGAKAFAAIVGSMVVGAAYALL